MRLLIHINLWYYSPSVRYLKYFSYKSKESGSYNHIGSLFWKKQRTELTNLAVSKNVTKPNSNWAESKLEITLDLTAIFTAKF